MFRYSTDLQPDASLSASEKEALMGIVVRVEVGKTGSVEHWMHLADEILLRSFIECASKFAADNGLDYPDNGPIFVNGKMRPWAGTNGNRFPDFTLFEGNKPSNVLDKLYDLDNVHY